MSGCKVESRTWLNYFTFIYFCVEDPKVGVGAVIWAEGKQVSQKLHWKLDFMIACILIKNTSPLAVTMWWHGSALPSGLRIQRLSSGLTIRRVPSDGSQAEREREQEVPIHPPRGAERAHIQVRLMKKCWQQEKEVQSLLRNPLIPRGVLHEGEKVPHTDFAHFQLSTESCLIYIYKLVFLHYWEDNMLFLQRKFH